MIELRAGDSFIEFGIRVVPRASRTEITGEIDGMVRVRVASPPVDGAANTEIVKFFAKVFSVPKSAVAIVSGHASRTKRLRISGLDARKAEEMLKT